MIRMVKRDLYYLNYFLRRIYCKNQTQYISPIPWSKVQPYVKNTFDTFAKMFPDHVGTHNSGFIVDVNDWGKGTWPRVHYKVWFYCGHWEGGCSLSIQAVQYFLAQMEYYSGGSGQVENIDCGGEKLLMCFCVDDYKDLARLFRPMKYKTKRHMAGIKRLYEDDMLSSKQWNLRHLIQDHSDEILEWMLQYTQEWKVGLEKWKDDDPATPVKVQKLQKIIDQLTKT